MQAMSLYVCSYFLMLICHRAMPVIDKLPQKPLALADAWHTRLLRAAVSELWWNMSEIRSMAAATEDDSLVSGTVFDRLRNFPGLCAYHVVQSLSRAR